MKTLELRGSGSADMTHLTFINTLHQTLWMYKGQKKLKLKCKLEDLVFDFYNSVDGHVFQGDYETIVMNLQFDFSMDSITYKMQKPYLQINMVGAIYDRLEKNLGNKQKNIDEILTHIELSLVEDGTNAAKVAESFPPFTYIYVNDPCFWLVLGFSKDQVQSILHENVDMYFLSNKSMTTEVVVAENSISVEEAALGMKTQMDSVMRMTLAVWCCTEGLRLMIV